MFRKTDTAPPTHLSPEAKQTWAWITENWVMDESGVLPTAAFEALDEMRAAQKIVKREGMTC